MNRTLSSSAGAASVSSHGDGLGLLLDVLEELDGAGQLPAIDGLSGLAGVLERNSEVGTAGTSRLRGLDLGGSVSNLQTRKPRSARRSTISQSLSHEQGYFGAGNEWENGATANLKFCKRRKRLSQSQLIRTYHLGCCAVGG